MIETGLRDRVVIVTGAGAGIGRATARRFAAEGAKVAAWDVHLDANDLEAELKAVAKGAGHEDGETLCRTVDVTDRDAVEHAVAEIVERRGGIHVLINNAGIVRDAQLVKWRDGQVVSTMSDEDFDAVLNVNLKGVFLCTRAVVPHMIEAQQGVILTASSVVGLYGNFGQTNYSATKAGVINMTRGWARELGRHGIRANAVAPGFIATDMVQSMPDKIIAGMVGRTPSARLGRPEEVAEAYLWLAADAASFVNGTVLSVDGGLVLGT